MMIPKTTLPKKVMIQGGKVKIFDLVGKSESTKLGLIMKIF